MRDKKIAPYLIIMLVLAIGMLTACGGSESPQAPQEEEQLTKTEPAPAPTEVQPTEAAPPPTEAAAEPQPTEPPAEPALPASSWLADGVVADGEYGHSATLGDVNLWWHSDGESPS